MNTQVKLINRPVGMPQASDFSIEQNEIPTIQEGEFLVKNEYISLDPAMRGWMRDVRSYIPPVQLGEVMRAGAVGEVIASKHPKYQVGDYASSWGGVQEYAVLTGENCHKVDPKIAPLPKYLGVLGMPGMTAYFGLLRIGEPKAGETVLVSGAAGAVGSVVGQISKIKGCRVVGIAGGPEKCQYLVDELGFDAAIDYKNESVFKGIRQHCPKGIDVYFDNVGGDILDAALANIRRHARIVICGAISQYNEEQQIKGPNNYLALLVNRAKMEGMVVMDYAKDYRSAAMEMGMWMMEGKLKTNEYIVEGLETFPDALLRLFNGNKKGKLILKV